MEKLERIAVPVDFSPFSKYALRTAAFLARRTGAELFLVHVIQERMADSAFHIPLPPEEEMIAQAHAWADKEYAAFLHGEDLEGIARREELRFGKPAHAIIAFSDEFACDLIVIASHGRSGFDRAVFGSVAERVLRLAHVPVLVTRDGGAG